MGNWKTLLILDSTPHLIFMPEISAVLQVNCDSFTVPLVREGIEFFKVGCSICSATRRQNTQTTIEDECSQFIPQGEGASPDCLDKWL